MPDILDSSQTNSDDSAKPVPPNQAGQEGDSLVVDTGSSLLRPGADAPKSETPVVAKPDSVNNLIVPAPVQSSEKNADKDELASVPVPADVSVDTLHSSTTLNTSDPVSHVDDNLLVPVEPTPPPVETPPPATPSGKKPVNRNMILGLAFLFLLISTGFVFVFVNQQASLNDIRNRAADGVYPGDCNFTTKKCTPPLVCHCQDGDACTRRACEQPTVTKNSCIAQGRSWCTNQYGQAFTCCVKGYSCGSSNGCFKDSNYTYGQSSYTSYSYGQSTYQAYTYGQSTYYGYGQSSYYGYGQSTYTTTYSYGQSTYTTTYSYGQSTYTTTYSYGQSTYQAVSHTPTPTPGSQCISIKIYKNGEVVSPGSLRPGDEVVIAVVGGNASKARIRINGGAWMETSVKNSAGEFILNYTIPSNQTHFVIQSEIYGTDGAWH